MPRMSGREALERILAARPSTRIIVASANLGGTALEELLLMGARAFLPKPYSPAALATAIRNALGASAPSAPKP